MAATLLYKGFYSCDTEADLVSLGSNSNFAVTKDVNGTGLNGKYWVKISGTWTQITPTTGIKSNIELGYNFGSGNVGFDNGDIQLAQNSSPIAPSSGNIKLFGRSIAGRIMSGQIGPSGLDTALQPLLARNKVGYWNPPGNATTVPGVFGFTAPTIVGTATARNVATKNFATRMRRLGYVSSTTAGSLAEARVGAAQFSCGSGSNDGSGFFYVTRFIPSNAATVSGERFFAGLMSSTSAATNVEPNTLTNCIGVAQLSTDSSQLYLVYGGSIAQTAVALGSTDFPGSTLSTDAFELAIFAPNSTANTFYIQVTHLNSGVSYTNTLTGASTIIPQSNTLLAHRVWKSNNATALAVAFDVCSIYFETDN